MTKEHATSSACTGATTFGRAELEALKAWVRAEITAKLNSEDDFYALRAMEAESALDALFAASEDEVPNEARRWHPVMHGRGLVQTWRLEDQDGNRSMQEGNQLWTGTRSQAHERARALNRQELGIKVDVK